MSALLKPRDYQEACIDALMAPSDSGATRRAAVLPTGAGKTVVFSHLIARFLAANPRQRVLVLAHTDELVTQAVKKLRVVAPHLRVGIVKAARNEVQAQVIVASVQSLRNPRRRDTIRDVGLVVVDECHHATAKTYRDILTHYGCMGRPCEACAGVGGSVSRGHENNPWHPRVQESGNMVENRPCSDCMSTGLDQGGTNATPLMGFTATLVRGDNASLSDIWQTVAYRKDISFMIRRGYLLNPIGKRIEVDDLDLRKVKKSGGDYQAHALEEALDASLAPEIVAKAYVEHAGTRSGILFAPTVDSAYTFASELVGQGVSAEVVHGALPQEERRAILRRLESGETQVIANCMVLTEGFDSPKVSCIVIARPTRSSGLYQQMVGRGLRPDLTLPREGQDCLILDVVGASQVHGLASLVDLSAKEIRLIDGQGLIEMEDEFDLADDLGAGDGPIRTTFYGPTVVVDFDPLADASRRVWMKTDGGTYFLSAGAGQGSVYVFVIPATPQMCDCADQCDDRAVCHDSRGNEVRCGDDCQHGEWPRCVDGHHGEAPCVPCGGAGRVAGAPGTYDVVWACKDYRDRVDGKAGGVTEHVGVTLDLAFAWGEDVAADMGGLTGDMTLNKRAGWRKVAPTENQKAKCRRMRIEIPDGATSGDVSTLIDVHIATRRLDPLAAHFASLTVGV